MGTLFAVSNYCVLCHYDCLQHLTHLTSVYCICALLSNFCSIRLCNDSLLFTIYKKVVTIICSIYLVYFWTPIRSLQRWHQWNIRLKILAGLYLVILRIVFVYYAHKHKLLPRSLTLALLKCSTSYAKLWNHINV